MSTLKLKTAPAVEPVTIDEVYDQLRITSTAEEILLTSYIKAAREYVENLCGPLISQTWYQYEQDWPCGDSIIIGKPRLSSVTSVKYRIDGDAADTTLSTSDYSVDDKDEAKPKIVLDDDASWPSDDLEEVNPITVEFVCGYGATASTVPEPIRLAILLLVSQWYEQRLPVYTGQGSPVEIPFAVNALLANYRHWGF